MVRQKHPSANLLPIHCYKASPYVIFGASMITMLPWPFSIVMSMTTQNAWSFQKNLRTRWVLVHSPRRFLCGVPSQFAEAHLRWMNCPFTESVPHLGELTSSFTQLVKNYNYSALYACMCMHWHIRTLSWLYPAEFNQRNCIRSVQHNWVHSSNRIRSTQRNWVHWSIVYVQRSAIEYILHGATEYVPRIQS
jgi:hypothetical protein